MGILSGRLMSVAPLIPPGHDPAIVSAINQTDPFGGGVGQAVNWKLSPKAWSMVTAQHKLVMYMRTCYPVRDVVKYC